MTVIDSTFNSAFINTDLFATSVTWKVDGTGGGNSIDVNFFLEGDVIDTEAGEVEVEQPMAQAISTDVTGADHDSIMIIGGTTYYVTKVITDGEGMTVLYLSEQQVT